MTNFPMYNTTFLTLPLPLYRYIYIFLDESNCNNEFYVWELEIRLVSQSERLTIMFIE